MSMADLRHVLTDRAADFTPPTDGFDRLVRLRRRRRRSQRIRTTVGALAVAALGMWIVVVAIGGHRTAPAPRPAFEQLSPSSARLLRPTWSGAVEPNQAAVPAASGTEVYVAQAHDGLVAFPTACRRESCTPRWRGTVPAAAVSFANSPAVDDGIVVVATDALTVFPQGCAVSGRVCAPLWTTEPTADKLPLSTPTIADGRVFVGASDGTVRAYSATCRTDGGTCAPLWTARTGASLAFSPPAVADGVVAVVSDRLYVYPEKCAARCRPLWTSDLRTVYESQAGHGIALDGPAAGGGHVFAVDGSTLLAFEAACRTDGGACRPSWTFTEPAGDILSSPVEANGRVYVASRRLFAFAVSCGASGRTCAPAWRSAPAGIAMSTPTAGAGVVAVAADRVEVFQPACGSQRVCRPRFDGPTVTAGIPLSRPAVSTAGVFVTTQDGRIIAYQVPPATPQRTG
jgi:outer membrane protein assembly factor BamB